VGGGQTHFSQLFDRIRRNDVVDLTEMVVTIAKTRASPVSRTVRTWSLRSISPDQRSLLSDGLSTPRRIFSLLSSTLGEPHHTHVDNERCRLTAKFFFIFQLINQSFISFFEVEFLKEQKHTYTIKIQAGEQRLALAAVVCKRVHTTLRK